MSRTFTISFRTREEAVEQIRSQLSEENIDTRHSVTLGEVALRLYRGIPDDAPLLDLAIEAIQLVIERASVSQDPWLQFSLAGRLHSRYRLRRNLDDLNHSISASRRAVELTADDDPNYTRRVVTLGTITFERYQRTKQLDDLQDAVELSGRVVELEPDGSAIKTGALCDYGTALLERFYRNGDDHDLELCISILESAARLVRDGHPGMPVILANLGASLCKRFMRSGELSDLNHSINILRGAINVTPDGNPYKIPLLANLAMSLITRARYAFEISDIEDAVSVQRSVIALVPDEDIAKPGYLSLLGLCLSSRFEHLGSMQDIETAIGLHRRVLESTPSDHSENSVRMDRLGNSLFWRYKRVGDIEDLDESISLRTCAIEASVEEPGPLLNALGISLHWRFLRNGEFGDLEKSISLHRRAVELSAENRVERAGPLHDLGISLFTRYETTGDPNDIEMCITSIRRAIELTSEGYSNLALMYNSLGGVLYRRSGDHAKNRQDLDDSIAAFRRANELTADENFYKPLLLSQICEVMRRRFEHSSDILDIDFAIESGRRALDLTPDGHSDMFRPLSAVALCLYSRAQMTKSLSDINDAIAMFNKVLELVQDDYPHRPMLLIDLAIAQELLFKYIRTQSNFDTAFHSYMAATAHPLGPASVRLSCAKDCAHMLSENPDFSSAEKLLSAHSRVISILPQMAWLGDSVHRRIIESAKVSKLTRAAVAAAISVGALTQGLEWLEASRALIWSQVLSLRTPLDELREVHAALAASFQNVQKELQRSTPTSFTPESNILGGVTGLLINTQADRHRGFAIEYEKLLKEIRRQAGFEYFLLPKKLEALIPSPALITEPVVFINVDPGRCDALILCASTKLMTVNLPDLSQERAGQLRSLWVDSLKAVRARWTPSPNTRPQLRNVIDRHSSRVEDEDGDSNFHRLLRYLWLWIVNPILRALELTIRPEGQNLPHITWCPTGPLVQLPIHAAGIYDEIDGSRTFDFVVSSYTPTLSALVRSYEGLTKERPTPSVMLVTQPETPGHPRLPGTNIEGLRLRTLLDEGQIDCKHFDHDEAKIEAILSVVDQYTWVHLACHGSQHKGDATQSAFALHDGSLSLQDLMRTTADNAELAFLSACQTATGDENNPEEATHLAAGMLAVGFKGVVATMWSIQDDDAPIVVEAFYKKLLTLRREGAETLKGTGAAYALHEAARVLREEVGKTNFMRWVPFVHFGA